MVDNYPYHGALADEYRRLQAMQVAYDPATRRVLKKRGVAEGWCCLEVGAGAGSIAQWLCGQVGTNGQVVATDINTIFLRNLNEPNLTVMQHDVTTDVLEPDRYHLIHARFLLDVLPARDQALDNMVFALKPGGWLVLEEFDSITCVPDPAIGERGLELFMKVQHALRMIWQLDGFDAEFGRKIMGQLLCRGLEEPGSEGIVFVRQGGTPSVDPWRLSVERLRARFVETGLVTEDEIDHHQAMLDDPHLLYLSPLRIIAWGRKPAG